MNIMVHVQQKAAISAGHASWGPISLELTDEMLAELSPDERADLAAHDLIGGASPWRALGTASNHDADSPALAEATWPAVRALLGRRREAREARRAQQMAEQAAADVAYQEARDRILAAMPGYLEQEAQHCLSRQRTVDEYLHVPGGTSFRVRRDDDEMRGVLQAVNARFQALIGERDAAIAERRAAEAAAEEAAIAEKQQYRDRWVAECGDPDLQEQHRAGLLCREDLMELVDESVLDPIGPADKSTYCDDSSHRCGDKVVACIPRRTFPAWRKVKAKLPLGTTGEFVKITPCERGADANGEYDYDDDGCGPSYYAVRIRVPSGPFHFERTIKL